MDNDSSKTHYQALRDLLYRAIREQDMAKANQGLQAQEVLNSAAFLAFQTGVAVSSEPLKNPQQAGVELPEQDKETMKTILWDMVTRGVIVPGYYGAVDSKWPAFTVSGYGHDVLRGDPESPYDPEGFVRALVDASPGVDDAVLFYVGQSLNCFLSGFLEASAVLLGVAAEKVVLDLADAYEAHLASSKPEALTRFRTAVRGKYAARQVDGF